MAINTPPGPFIMNPDANTSIHQVQTQLQGPGRHGALVTETAITYPGTAGSSYTGTSFTAIAASYPVVTFNKTFKSTVVRVKLGITAFVTGAPGLVRIGATVNGGGVQLITQYWFNTLSDHRSFTGVSDFTPPGYTAANQTGPMLLIFYAAVTAGQTLNIDTNDFAAFTIGEVAP